MVGDEDVYVAESGSSGDHDLPWRIGVEEVGFDVLGTHTMSTQFFKKRSYAVRVGTPLLLGIVGGKDLQHQIGTEERESLGRRETYTAPPANACHEGHPT